MENFTIINYEEKYFAETTKFLNEVAVNEFKFYDWKNYFDTGKFLQLKSKS